MWRLAYLLLAGSCAVASAPPDMALRAVDDVRCLGPEDADRVLWWSGYTDPSSMQRSFDDKRYVCIDHGPDRNGYWYEQVPPG